MENEIIILINLMNECINDFEEDIKILRKKLQKCYDERNNKTKYNDTNNKDNNLNSFIRRSG